MQLPEGEDPTIATVSDLEQLSNQPVFTFAKEGDRVLLFPRSMKIIIYDEEEDRIVDVSRIEVGSPSATYAPAKVR